MKLIISILRVFSALVLCSILQARAQSSFETVTVPNHLLNVYGNADFDAFFDDLRYQQVHDASEFSTIQPNGGMITAISFRPADGVISSGKNIPSFTIRLSTTSAQPDSLSPVFGSNLGNDTEIVFQGGMVLGGIGGSPDRFRATIELQTPFYYSPQNGNLLLDIQTAFTEAGRLRFDAQDVVGDSISSIRGWTYQNEAYATTSLGFVTQFTIQPVPEPSGLWLVMIGSLFVFTAWRKQE